MSEKEIEKLRAEINAIYEGLSFILSRIDEIEKAAAGYVEVGLWDPHNIEWIVLEGPSGPYERADQQEVEDFQLMLKDLKAHKGRLTQEGYFYWLFTDQATVGRKLRVAKKGSESSRT